MHLGPDFYGPFIVVSSHWLAEKLKPHHILYPIVQVLTKQNQTIRKPKTKQAIPPTIAAKTVTKEQRIIKVEREMK